MFPGAPLYTLQRTGCQSGQKVVLPEVTVSGLVCVVTDDPEPILITGQPDTLIWGRSLIKPFQLLTLLPVLAGIQESGPTSEHYAMMMASHSGEPDHVSLLQEIVTLGHLQESMLQCPACYPLHAPSTKTLKDKGLPPTVFYHPCCGKHLALLWALSRTEPEAVPQYLNPSQRFYGGTRKLLAHLLGKNSEEVLLESVDGCGMPTWALTAQEIAVLFWQLANQPAPLLQETAPEELKAPLSYWDHLRRWMLEHPELIGGTDRLDTRIMKNELPWLSGDISKDYRWMIAKEGADGLLALGVGAGRPEDPYPRGLGIFIKLASGYDLSILETTLRLVCESLGLARQTPLEIGFNPVQIVSHIPKYW